MRAALIVLLCFCINPLIAGVVGKEVTYASDTLTMHGYLAYNDSLSGKRPGILVVHEWWGLNGYARKRAEMLAGLGYVALALDMYGNGKQAAHPDDAGKFAGEVSQNLPLMTSRFLAAMNYLRNDEHVDTSRIGAIGYCFGGGVVLQMAREGVNLKGVVSFHGALATKHPAEKGKVKARVLACNGASDKFIPADDIRKFKAEMKAAGVDYKFVNYPGAVHSFTNPASTELGKRFNLPMAYNAAADKGSWREMQSWLKKAFAGK